MLGAFRPHLESVDTSTAQGFQVQGLCEQNGMVTQFLLFSWPAANWWI